jgi:hypothetical protein
MLALPDSRFIVTLDNNFGKLTETVEAIKNCFSLTTCNPDSGYC